jgi:branched-chain amino acid transport system permease protein
LQGLVWFATVVVAGADSALGAVLAAALLVGLDAGTQQGISTVVVGALALAIGRLPGGLAGRISRLGARAPALTAAPSARLTPLGRRLRGHLLRRASADQGRP